MSDLIPLLERSIAIAKAKAGPVIGASQIAAILGIDRFTTPEQLFARMTGAAPAEPENPDMKRGKHLEGGLCAWWCDLASATRQETHFASRGVVLGNGQLQVMHPLFPWARATADVVAECLPVNSTTRALVACDTKCPRSDGKKVGDEWVKVWSQSAQAAPLSYIAQSTYQVGVLRAAGVPVEIGELAAGPCWGELIRVAVPFDAEVFADILGAAERFRACVLAGVLSDEFKTKESNQ